MWLDRVSGIRQRIQHHAIRKRWSRKKVGVHSLGEGQIVNRICRCGMIAKGDTIVAINGVACKGASFEQLLAKLEAASRRPYIIRFQQSMLNRARVRVQKSSNNLMYEPHSRLKTNIALQPATVKDNQHTHEQMLLSWKKMFPLKENKSSDNQTSHRL